MMGGSIGFEVMECCIMLKEIHDSLDHPTAVAMQVCEYARRVTKILNTDHPEVQRESPEDCEEVSLQDTEY